MRLRYADFPTVSAFGLRPDDVVTIDASLTFDLSGGEARLIDRTGRSIGRLANAPVDLLKEFLAALDGQRTFGSLCAEEPFARHADNLRALVSALLGKPFLLSAVTDELERQLPAAEILRFPSQSPYAMPREYWENSIAVRQALDRFYAGLADLETFTYALRGLHRLATIGTSGTNYYGGAGGVATVPGELRTAPIGNYFDERRKSIVHLWLQLLDARLPLVESGWIVSTNQTPLVEIADNGHVCRHPYGPAGELLARQLDEMRAYAAEARAAAGNDRNGLLRHCALFHHAFAHAHPFANINNSIAMNVVNDLLGSAGIGVVPHLYFDRVALFLQPEDYVRLFARAVEAHVINEEAGRDRRATELLRQAVNQ